VLKKKGPGRKRGQSLLSTLRPLLPGSVSQYRKASCIAGSVNNVGQDEILHIGAGWLHPLDSDGP